MALFYAKIGTGAGRLEVEGIGLKRRKA